MCRETGQCFVCAVTRAPPSGGSAEGAKGVTRCLATVGATLLGRQRPRGGGRGRGTHRRSSMRRRLGWSKWKESVRFARSKRATLGLRSRTCDAYGGWGVLWVGGSVCVFARKTQRRAETRVVVLYGQNPPAVVGRPKERGLYREILKMTCHNFFRRLTCRTNPQPL